MQVYYYFIAYVIGVGFLAHYNHAQMPPRIKYQHDDNVWYKNQYGFWYLLLFAGFAFVSSFRYRVGTDFNYYYRIQAFEWSDVWELFLGFDEPGFPFLITLARGMWDHGVANIVISSILITMLVFYGISQYDQNQITFSLLLYMFTGVWLFSFNGIAQALAVATIFAFSKKSESKWWILKYVVVVLVACLFHSSALVLLPVLILSQRKINFTQIIVIFVSALAIPMFFDWVYQYMQVDLTEEDSLVYIESTINPIRVVVAFAPLALLLIAVYKKKFVEKHYFLTNMVIFNAVLTLVTAHSAYLNRVTKYTTIFIIAFIPECLKATTKNMRIVTTVLTVVLYLAFFLYEIHNSPYLNNFRWSFDKFIDYGTNVIGM